MKTHAGVLTQEDLLAIPVIAECLPLCSFPVAGTKINCAVSGGADSTALLVLAVAAGCIPTAFHVDHGLRVGSDKESDIVKETAFLLGTNFSSLQVAVGDGPNLEARAREARYKVLPPGVATGHTADDQAETVILNMLRGTSLGGLRGMKLGYSHPILNLRRVHTEAICSALNLDIVHDPTNSQTIFRRNKVRHMVVPLLNEVAEKDVVPVIARMAEQAQEMYIQLNETAKMLIDDPSSVKQLRAAPPAIAKHALHQWLAPQVPQGKTIDAATIDRAMEVVRGNVRATQLPGGASLNRTRGVLHVTH